MKRAMILAAAALLCAAIAPAQQPPSAAAIMDEAKAKAAQNQRVIFAIYHASWCGWCKKLDAFVESADIKPIFEKYFVRAYFTVQEREEKQALNTPGAEELLVSMGGPKNAGLPFFAFLDSKGGLIVNSMRPDAKTGKLDNIGHPAQPEEVDWFMTMVRRAVPSIAPEEAAKLEKYLRTQKK